jgi:hypothetical protein
VLYENYWERHHSGMMISSPLKSKWGAFYCAVVQSWYVWNVLVDSCSLCSHAFVDWFMYYLTCCNIWGLHGSEHSNWGLLGCDVMCCSRIPLFQRIFLPPSSGWSHPLKCWYPTATLHILEDFELNLTCWCRAYIVLNEMGRWS